MRRVPATVITGFLGAGKTSLVRHLLAHAEGRRLAVVVNEFGKLGIDRKLLLGCSDADAFVSRLRAAIVLHDVLRVKGFVDRPGHDRRLVVQAVGSRMQQHFDRPWDARERRETRLVVIGKRGLDRAAIRSAFAPTGV
jgi:cobalamin biosynthesis protein CobW